MKTWNRLLWGLLGLVLCLAGISAAQSEGVLDLDFSWLPGVQEVARRPTPPPPATEIIHHRLRAKTKVVRELIDGQLTLFEAAAWFRYFNETPADCQDKYRASFPGASDEEKLCRQVIYWVDFELRVRGSVDLASATVARLEEELHAHLREHGKVLLPLL